MKKTFTYTTFILASIAVAVAFLFLSSRAQATNLFLSTVGTSTMPGGLNMGTGCFAINGVCLTSGTTPTGTTGQVAYFSGTNTAVGTSTLFISTASNVGIGTTTPPAILTADAQSSTSVSPFSVWAPTVYVLTAVSTTTYSSGQTWNKPAGLISMVVYTYGGGGGGGGAADSTHVGGNGGSGAASSFTYNSGGNTVLANGGVGGAGSHNASPTTGAGGTASGGDTNTTGQAGTTSTGGLGGANLGLVGGAQSASNTGGNKEGGGGGGGGAADSNIGGGGGGYSKKSLIASQLGTTETIVAGAGGGGGGMGVGGGNGNNAASASGSTPGAGGTTTNSNPAGGLGGAPDANGVNPGGTQSGGGGAGGAVVIVTTVMSTSTTFGTAFTTSFITTTTGGAATTSPTVGIGTTTPSATFSVQGAFGAILTMLSHVINGLTYIVEEIDSKGHLITGGPAPTCGTGCSSVVGDDRTFEVLSGSSVSAITVNFANTYTKSPSCIPTEASLGSVAIGASTTPTTMTITTASAVTTKWFTVICQISNNFTF